MWFLLFIILLYYIFILFLIAGWNKLSSPWGNTDNNIMVSVIIPVRNEAPNIKNLLNDLEDQDYPADGYEVILINDHSEDGTHELIQEKILSSNIPIYVFELPADHSDIVSHKKAAITFGINKAKGEVMILTDGDCRFGRNWIKSHMEFFTHEDHHLLAGPVFMENTSGGFISEVQTIEFASLIGSGAAMIGWGHPVMCNGANLAFRKASFQVVNGYFGNEYRISGDDEYLLYKMSARFPGGVGFLKSAEGLVITPHPENLRSFYHQRKRWAGKWRFHGNIKSRLLAIFIFLVHLCIISVICLVLAGFLPPVYILWIFIPKICLELLFLDRLFSFFNKKLKLIPFLFTTLFYSVYAVSFGIISNFGKFEWKNRTYKS